MTKPATDEAAKSEPAKRDSERPGRRRPEFELDGNKLVCKCHGQVVLTFDPDVLAAHHQPLDS